MRTVAETDGRGSMALTLRRTAIAVERRRLFFWVGDERLAMRLRRELEWPTDIRNHTRWGASRRLEHKQTQWHVTSIMISN